MTARFILLALFALVLVRCAGDSTSPQAGQETAGATTATGSIATTSSSNPVVSAVGTCPLTLANGSSPPGQKPSAWNHGNGKLWTWLWRHNLVVAVPGFLQEDGSIDVKWPWWRGVEGVTQDEGGDSCQSASATAEFRPTTAFRASGQWIMLRPKVFAVTGIVGSPKLTLTSRRRFDLRPGAKRRTEILRVARRPTPPPRATTLASALLPAPSLDTYPAFRRAFVSRRRLRRRLSHRTSPPPTPEAPRTAPLSIRVCFTSPAPGRRRIEARRSCSTGLPIRHGS